MQTFKVDGMTCGGCVDPMDTLRALSSCSLEQGREMRQLLRHNRADSQPLVMAGREARLGVIKQLEAPTLDRDVLVAELAKAREADMALRALVDSTLAQFAGTLPREERQKLVEALYLRGQAGGVKPRS